MVLVDPAYLAMPGSDAGNVMAQGERLARVNDICQRHRACFILLHHNTKTSVRQNKHKPSRLDSLAWSGYAEWARQWILLGRREDYVEGTGFHRLWMNVGGSAGHSSLWALDVDEGPADESRHWEVTLSTPSEACEEKTAMPIRERIISAARKFPNGESKTVILDTARVKSNVTTRNVWDSLVKEGQLVPRNITKHGATYPGFCVSA